jgi:gas vesicle protein
MRVHQVADELEVSNQEVLEVLNEDLGLDVNHHMASVDETTVRRVKVALQDNTPDPEMIVQEPGELKNLYGSAIDSLAFGIGLGLLLAPERGQKTRETIGEEITSLGQEVTDPMKIAGEEVIDLLDVLPTQLSQLTNYAVEYGSDQVEDLGPYLQGAFDEAVHLVSSSRFSTNFTNGKEATESKQEVR